MQRVISPVKFADALFVVYLPCWLYGLPFVPPGIFYSVIQITLTEARNARGVL